MFDTILLTYCNFQKMSEVVRKRVNSLKRNLRCRHLLDENSKYYCFVVGGSKKSDTVQTKKEYYE